MAKKKSRKSKKKTSKSKKARKKKKERKESPEHKREKKRFQKEKSEAGIKMPGFKIKFHLSKKSRKEAKVRKFLEDKGVTKEKTPKKLGKDVIKQLIVADVMSQDPVTFKASDRLSYVVRLFSRKHISGAPVLSEDQIVGMVTKSDIIKVIGVKDLLDIDSSGLKKLEDVKVSEIMKKKIKSVKRHTKIAEATQIMNKQNINILPVVDDKKHIVGVVSRGDIVRIISKELLTKAVKDRHRKVKDIATIETDIDTVLDIVEKEGSIGLFKIKDKLMIHEDKIEEWAKILDEEGLAELYYPAFGSPILRKRIKSKTKSEEE